MGEATGQVGEVERLEHEVDVLRDDLTGTLSELDHRRHELTDVRLQLRRHALPLGLIASGLVLLAGGLIGFAWWNHRRRQRPLARMHRLRDALSRMVNDPSAVARTSPSIAKQALGAAAGAAAGFAARTAIEKVTRAVRQAG